MSATQDEVFKKVGQAAVNNVLGTEITLISVRLTLYYFSLIRRWF